MLSKDKAAFLVSLADEEGHIEPAAVVEAARDPACPLHDEFQWDIRKAALENWMDTARTLIRVVRLEVTIEDRKVFAPLFVADPARPPKSKRYVELSRLARDSEMAERVVLDELERITNAIRRAQNVAAVLGLSTSFESMLANAVSLRMKAERAAAARARSARRRPASRKVAKRGATRHGRRGHQ